MSKIAFLGDTHFGVRKNSPIMLNHQIDFFKKIFFPIVDKLNIKSVIHFGDFFHHRKNVDFFILEGVKKHILDEFKKRNLNLYIIIGNHDTYFSDTNNLNSIGTISKEYGFNILDKPQDIEVEGENFCIIPWINKSNSELSENLIKTTKSKFLLGHLEIQNFTLTKGFPSIKGFEPKTFCNFQHVYSGHFHLKSQNGNITYLGTPFENTWDDYGEEKGFYIFDTTCGKTTFIPNKIKLFKKLFYDGINNSKIENIENKFIKLVIKNKTDNNVDLENYIKQIQELKPLDLKFIEENTTVKSIKNGNVEVDALEDTKTLIMKYIDELEGLVVDKKTLSDTMIKIYLEASEL